MTTPPPRALLSPAFIAALPTTGERYTVRDTDVPGLSIRVYPTGAKKYAVEFRVKGDRAKRREALGTFPAMSLTQARREARAKKALASIGTDPAAERDTKAAHRRQRLAEARAAREKAQAERTERRRAEVERTRHTVHQLALDYIRDRRTRLKPSTTALYSTTVTRYLAGTFGARPIATLTQSEVRELIRTVQEGGIPEGIPKRKGKRVKTGGEGAARTLRRFLASVWNYAHEERGIVSGDCPVPTASRLGLVELEKERFLTPDECASILRALDIAATDGLAAAPHRARKPVTGPTAKHRPAKATAPQPADPIAVSAIRFALLTGWRRGEVLSLRWDMLRKDLGRVILTGTKTGESVRELAPQAWAVLDGIPRVGVTPFVFPSMRTAGPLRDISRLWDAVRHHAGIAARFHDMRHTAASLAINNGATLEEVQSMLGHLSARTTSRYAKLIPSTGRRAAEKVAAALDAARATPPTPVTPITAARARRA